MEIQISINSTGVLLLPMPWARLKTNWDATSKENKCTARALLLLRRTVNRVFKVFATITLFKD